MKTIGTPYKRISILSISIIISIFVIYISTQLLSKVSIHNTTLRLRPRQEQLIGVQYALRENNVPQAIHSMPTQTAKDFYNRATLKTLRAYQLIEQGNIVYQKVLQEAQEDFNTARSKTTNIYLQQKIKNNLSMSNNMQYIGDIQICFSDFNTLLDDLTVITDRIDQTRASIQDQLQYIQENTDTLNQIIGEECKQNIQDTFNKSYNALTQANNNIQKQTDIYTKILQEHINNPALCLQTNLKPIIQNTQSIQTKIQESQQTYAITQIALQTQNLGILQQMCEQTQDDTLSNQDLEQSLSQLLENLENSLQSPQPSENESSSGQEDTQNQGPTSSQPQYIPLTQEEKILLEQAQQTNQQWINTMMQIKKNNYNPANTLQTIFEIFYGDTSEFNIPGW